MPRSRYLPTNGRMKKKKIVSQKPPRLYVACLVVALQKIYARRQGRPPVPKEKGEKNEPTPPRHAIKNSEKGNVIVVAASQNLASSLLLLGDNTDSGYRVLVVLGVSGAVSDLDVSAVVCDNG